MKIKESLKLITLVFFVSSFIYSQTPTPTPSPNVVGEVNIKDTKANKDPLYQKFRNLSEDKGSFGGTFATVNNLVLKRDAGTFTLKSGEIYFLKAENDRTTGAVFFGDGEFSITPPTPAEKTMLNYFGGSPDFKEAFTELVIFFTDQTFEEVKSSPNGTISSNGSRANQARDSFRDKEDLLKMQFRYNMPARILLDAYSPPRPGFFMAFIDGKKYSKLLYQMDPLGIDNVSPEQVMLLDYDREKGGIWTAFHLADEYKKGTAKSSTDRRLFDLTDHNIDLAIRGERLISVDKVTMKLLSPGQRVLPFDLFPSLRVKRILDEESKELDFIQEEPNRDSQLSVILPATKEVGKPFNLTFEYEGTNALRDVGSGNFILIPRSTWYPNNGGTQFGDRATFDVKFHYPKKFMMIGIGELVEPPQIEGDLKVEKWSTKGVEMAVAGFNYGDFKKKEVTDPDTGYLLEVYANGEMPGYFKDFLNQIRDFESRGGTTFTTLDAANTVSGMSNVLTEAQNSSKIYNLYFGKLPHKRIAMSQQPADNFGQAWATLIFMPFTAYLDGTLRSQIYGIRGGTSTFWKEVAAHEVSHEWWGHTVGWSSYHDQWMSEGFAQLSASLYIQAVKKDTKEFIDFWEEQRRLIVDASPATRDKKPYTVGPVTQGYRLNSGRTGNVARYLIYPKGAYILHMLRMMMYDRKAGGDVEFIKMMKDFTATHYNKDVSTEDFKAIVQKHITPKMDIDQNKTVDWFFDEWVYGTDVPAYRFEYSLNGDTLRGKITQSGVSDNFVMLVPLYADFGKGWIYLGNVTLAGNSTLDIGELKLPQAPQKVAICAYNDVLATKIENVKK